MAEELIRPHMESSDLIETLRGYFSKQAQEATDEPDIVDDSGMPIGYLTHSRDSRERSVAFGLAVDALSVSPNKARHALMSFVDRDGDFLSDAALEAIDRSLQPDQETA